MVRVDRYAAAPWAKGLPGVPSPADALERRVRLFLGQPHDIGQAEGPGLGGK